MKYKDLPQEKLIQKLLATSFESPSANRDVYDWCDSLLKHIRFLENERVKLVKKYGEEKKYGDFQVKKQNLGKFSEEFRKLLEMDIEDKIEKCPIKREWFDDESCSYPPEKNLWISPQEIGILMNL